LELAAVSVLRLVRRKCFIIFFHTNPSPDPKLVHIFALKRKRLLKFAGVRLSAITT